MSYVIEVDEKIVSSAVVTVDNHFPSFGMLIIREKLLDMKRWAIERF